MTENLELTAALRLAIDPPGGVSVEALCELARDDAASAWDIATAAEHPCMLMLNRKFRMRWVRSATTEAEPP